MKFSEYLQLNEAILKEKRNLNHKIFEGTVMHEDVKKGLIKVAKAFEAFLDMDKLKILDITLTGSLANYTWHDTSDVDVHIIVDFSGYEDVEIAQALCDSKRQLWNTQHDVEIKGFPVEMYVQDKNEPHASSGIYSLNKDKWLVKPKKVNPSINDSYVEKKANEWKTRIDAVVNHGASNLAKIDQMKARLRAMRKMGLDREGEFSVENLVFKVLRRDDYIDKLYEYALELEDDRLSMK